MITKEKLEEMQKRCDEIFAKAIARLTEQIRLEKMAEKAAAFNARVDKRIKG